MEDQQTPVPKMGQELKDIISRIFEPGSCNDTNFDFVSTSDVTNSIRELIECDTNEVFSAMVELSFDSKTIDNTLYWIVKS